MNKLETPDDNMLIPMCEARGATPLSDSGSR